MTQQEQAPAVGTVPGAWAPSSSSRTVQTLRENTDFSRSKELQAKAHAVIPGGCHTYAKGDDQYPVLAPGFIVRGEGCRVWDVDGNEYIEYGMGLRAVTLGHAYRPVIEAAYRQMLEGANFVRPAAIELECASRLASVVDSAEMVKFAKNGSDVTSAAVQLARAYTGRDLVAVCAEHPFFAFNDWFIGATAMPTGVPEVIRALTLKFHYNNIESVEALFQTYPGRIACVILEAATTVEPAEGFLHKLRDLCHRHGAVLILDEMITGFRWHLGGAQKYYDIVPDLSTFGKALANGFSLSALVGRRDIMEAGGIHHDRERVWLLSTTHGAETHSLAAAIEVMRTYEREPVIDHLYRQGERLTAGLRDIAADLGLSEHFLVIGKPCNLVYGTRDENKQPSQAFRALFLQETIRRGLLMPSLVVSYAHRDADIDYTIHAVGDALRVYRRALEDGVDKYLIGRPVMPVMRRFCKGDARP